MNVLTRLLFDPQLNQNLLLLGNRDSGKTSLLNWWSKGRPEPASGKDPGERHVRCADIAFRMIEVKALHNLSPSEAATVVNGCVVIFVVNAGDAGERTKESLFLLDDCLKHSAEHGIRHVWLLFNRLNQVDFKSDRLSALQGTYEEAVASRQAQAICTVLAVPYLSSRTGEGVDKALSFIASAVKGCQGIISPTPIRALRRTIGELAQPTFEEFLSSLRKGKEPFDRSEFSKVGQMLFEELVVQDFDLSKVGHQIFGALQEIRTAKLDLSIDRPSRTRIYFWVHLVATTVSDGKSKAITSGSLLMQMTQHMPELLRHHLPNHFYTKQLLGSVLAQEYFLPPNKIPLPLVTDGPGTSSVLSLAGLGSICRPGLRELMLPRQAFQDRPLRFAFAVAKWRLTHTEEAPDILQTFTIAHESYLRVTMRNRADNPGIAPYSKTQLEFWLNIVLIEVRAVIGNVADRNCGLHWSLFREISDIEANTWKSRYTPVTWYSIGARMTVVQPDVRGTAQHRASPSIKHAREADDNQEPGYDLPSEEDLVFYADVTLSTLHNRIANRSRTDSHAILLHELYESVIRWSRTAESLSGSAFAPYSTTKTVFWLDQILTAMYTLEPPKCTILSKLPPSMSSLQIHGNGEDIFEKLIRTTPHLAFEGLPFVYYMRESWSRSETLTYCMLPDRRPFEVHPLVQKILPSVRFGPEAGVSKDLGGEERDSNARDDAADHDGADTDTATLIGEEEDDLEDDWTMIGNHCMTGDSKP